MCFEVASRTPPRVLDDDGHGRIFIIASRHVDSPSPFEQFVKGEINPFDDVNKHNPKGAGQFGSINKQEDIPSNKPRLDDDTKITL